MAQSGVIETSIEGAEGGDELKAFLFLNENKLKSKATILKIHKALTINRIDQDDLMSLSEIDLRETLQTLEYDNNNDKLKSLEIGRLIGVIKATPGSEIFKASNIKPSKVVVVPQTIEEQQAINKIDKKKELILNILKLINNDIKELNTNNQKIKGIINNNFDEIIKKANQQRNKLINEIDTISNNKSSKLSNEQTKLKAFYNKLMESKEKMTKLYEDSSFDALKRQNKIIQISHNTLKDNIDVTYNQITKTVVNIDINDALNVLLTTGSVDSGQLSFPPKIQIAAITANSADVIIGVNEKNNRVVVLTPIGYKLKYAEYSDDVKLDEDDMKLDWQRRSTVADANKYTMKSLKPKTKYLVKVASHNKNGYGAYSKAVTFETKSAGLTFSVYHSKWVSMLKNNTEFVAKNTGGKNRMAASAVGYKTGYHEWKIKCIRDSGSVQAIGVLTSIDHVRQTEGPWFSSKCGYVYYWYGYDYNAIFSYLNNNTPNANILQKVGQSWGTGDIITVILDCDNSKMRFKKNNSFIGKMFDIKSNVTYYPALACYGAQDHYIILNDS